MQLPAAAAAPPLGSASAQASQTTPSAGGKKPNILFLMVDQMTPFMIGPYGQKAAITPNLDRLARNGATFDNAYCNAPLCVPSRTSMFSAGSPRGSNPGITPPSFAPTFPP